MAKAVVNCITCDKEFKSEKCFVEHCWSLTHHLICQQKIQEFKHYCILCKKTFKSANYYGSHLSGKFHMDKHTKFNRLIKEGKTVKSLIKTKVIVAPNENRRIESQRRRIEAEDQSKKNEVQSGDLATKESVQDVPADSHTDDGANMETSSSADFSRNDYSEQLWNSDRHMAGNWRRNDGWHHQQQQLNAYGWNRNDGQRQTNRSFNNQQWHQQYKYNQNGQQWSNQNGQQWSNQNGQQWNNHNGQQWNNHNSQQWNNHKGAFPTNYGRTGYYNNSTSYNQHREYGSNCKTQNWASGLTTSPYFNLNRYDNRHRTIQTEALQNSTFSKIGYSDENVNVSSSSDQSRTSDKLPTASQSSSCRKTQWNTESDDNGTFVKPSVKPLVVGKGRPLLLKTPKTTSTDDKSFSEILENEVCNDATTPETKKTNKPNFSDIYNKSPRRSPIVYSGRSPVGSVSGTSSTPDKSIKLLCSTPLNDNSIQSLSKNEFDKDQVTKLVNLSCTRKEKILLKRFIESYTNTQSKSSAKNRLGDRLLQLVEEAMAEDMIATLDAAGKDGTQEIDASVLPKNVLEQLATFLNCSVNDLTMFQKTEVTHHMIKTENELIGSRVISDSAVTDSTQAENMEETLNSRDQPVTKKPKKKAKAEKVCKKNNSSKTKSPKKLSMPPSKKKTKSKKQKFANISEVAITSSTDLSDISVIDSVTSGSVQTVTGSTSTSDSHVNAQSKVPISHGISCTEPNDTSTKEQEVTTTSKNFQEAVDKWIKKEVQQRELPPNNIIIESEQSASAESITPCPSTAMIPVNSSPSPLMSSVPLSLTMSVANAATNFGVSGETVKALDLAIEEENVQIQINVIERQMIKLQEVHRTLIEKRKKLQDARLQTIGNLLQNLEGRQHLDCLSRILADIPNATAAADLVQGTVVGPLVGSPSNPAHTDNFVRVFESQSSDNVQKPIRSDSSTAAPVEEAQQSDIACSPIAHLEKSKKRKKSSKEKKSKKSKRNSENLSKEMYHFFGHVDKIVKLQVVKDQLYSCSIDGTARRYKIKISSQQCRQMYTHRSSTVISMELIVLDDGTSCIVCVSRNGNLQKFNPDTGECLLSVDLPSHITCMTIRWGSLYVGIEDGSVSRCNLSNFKPVGNFICSKLKVTCLATAVEGAYRILCVGSEDRTVTIREAISGLLIRCFDLMNEYPAEFQIVAGTIFTRAICGNQSRTVYWYSLQSGDLMGSTRNVTDITCMQVVNSELLLIGSVDGIIRAISLRNNELKRRTTFYYGADNKSISALCLHKDLLISSNCEGKIQAVKMINDCTYNCNFGKCPAMFAYYEDMVIHVNEIHVMSSPKKCLATGCGFVFKTSEANLNKIISEHILDHVTTTFD